MDSLATKVNVEVNLHGLLELDKSDLSGTFLSSSYFLAISKNDMKYHICTLSKNDVKDLVKTYRIPLDLHPYLPDDRFTMDHLPADAIGIYSEFLGFFGVRHLHARLIHLRKMREEGAMVLLPTPNEIAASLLDQRLAKKSKGPVQARVHLDSEAIAEPNRMSKKRKLKRKALKVDSNALELGQTKGMDDADLTDFYAEIEDSLEKDEGASTRATSAPIPRLGKRLCAPLSMAVVSAYGPSHVGTLAHAYISGHSLSLGGAVVSGHARKSGAKVLRCQVDSLVFLARSAVPLMWSMIRFQRMILASLLMYTKKEWDGPHAPKCNFLCKDIFKDLDVCRNALDRTITPVELRRTESLLPLEFSNCVNILSALLKLKKKKGDVKVLRSEVTSLDNKLENLKRDYDALDQENRELRSQRDDASKEEEVTQFVTSGVEGIIQKLLSSDEFHAALARVASLGINYGVERGLHMGHSDVKFEAAVQKVSNFHVGSRADFDKALDDFPTTLFLFLARLLLPPKVVFPMFKFIQSASSFSSSDLWIVLLIGMPISADDTPT
nr:hypothetical protein [Tanacetum cinerariifolium]